jgi:hypothetical protein
MTLHSRSFILAASLVAMPLVGALAQNTNPAGNYGSNQSITASPGTADSKAASGMNTADSNATPSAIPPGATSNYTPGATGRTIVPGSNSTVAGATPGSQTEKTGTDSGGGSK